MKHENSNSEMKETSEKQILGTDSTPGRAPVSAALHAPESRAHFATGLIAAKPEKPCDGGVFGAFYLLSKKE